MHQRQQCPVEKKCFLMRRVTDLPRFKVKCFNDMIERYRKCVPSCLHDEHSHCCKRDRKIKKKAGPLPYSRKGRNDFNAPSAILRKPARRTKTNASSGNREENP